MYRCHSLFRITNFLFVFLLELLLFFLLFSFSCGNFTYSCCFDALPNLFFAMFFPTIHVYILLPCNTFFFVFFSTIVAMFGVFNLLFFLKDFKNCYCFRCWKNPCCFLSNSVLIWKSFKVSIFTVKKREGERNFAGW